MAEGDPGRVSPPRSKRRRLNSIDDKHGLASLEDELRVYSWNINGITPFIQPTITSFFKSKAGENLKEGNTKASLRDTLRCHKWPTIFCLQEVKINPDDSATIHAVEQAVKRQPSESFDTFDYEAHFCLPSDKHNARGFGRKVYGVCSIVRKDFKEKYVANIRSVDWDAEGRFLVIETKASERLPKLCIINIYAVNGTDHPYKDPSTGQVIGTRHDRKLEVHKRLQAECRTMEAAGFNVILAGDINIARGLSDGFPNLRTFPKQHCINRADFEARFLSSAVVEDQPPGQTLDQVDHISEEGLDMIDTFRHLHPTRKSYTFYPRSKSFGDSCDRVDMILISRGLEDNLIEAGMYETTSERGPSDHVPLYASFRFNAISPGEPG